MTAQLNVACFLKIECFKTVTSKARLRYSQNIHSQLLRDCRESCLMPFCQVTIARLHFEKLFEDSQVHIESSQQSKSSGVPN